MPLSRFSITLRRRSISASCPSSICRSLLSVVIIPNLFKPHVPTRGALGGSARHAAPRPRREKRLGLGLPRIGIELGDTLSKDAVHPRRRSWRFSGVRRKRSSANSVIRLNGKSCHRAAMANLLAEKQNTFWHVRINIVQIVRNATRRELKYVEGSGAVGHRPLGYSSA